MNFKVITYEQLCAKPIDVIADTVSCLGLEPLNELKLSHKGSHIALGNKGFTMRNRKEIRYDDSWTKRFTIKLAYALHFRARRIRTSLNSLAYFDGKK